MNYTLVASLHGGSLIKLRVKCYIVWWCEGHFFQTCKRHLTMFRMLEFYQDVFTWYWDDCVYKLSNISYMPAFCLPLVPSPEMSSYLKPEQLLRRHLAVSSWPQSGHSTSSHFRHTCSVVCKLFYNTLHCSFIKIRVFLGGHRCRDGDVDVWYLIMIQLLRIIAVDC